MNLVGRHGKGESVWLAFFLCHVLGEFAKVARLRDDPSFAERCEAEATQLRATNREERLGWRSGIAARTSTTARRWVRSRNAECQIDSVAQSWAVLSGAGDAERSRRAMNAVDARLVRRDHALIQLLDPPFDTSDSRARIHPRIRARCAGERWSVHPRRDLDCDGVRRARRQCTRLGIDGDDQPGQSRANAGRRRDLQGGTLRRRRRCLCARAAHGPRRLDLVHRLGRLDVPPCRGVAAGAQAGSGSTCVSHRASPPSGTSSRCVTATAKPTTTSWFSEPRRTREKELEAVSVTVDGNVQEGNFILLANDRQEHRVEVLVASRSTVPHLSTA